VETSRPIRHKKWTSVKEIRELLFGLGAELGLVIQGKK